MGRPSLPAKDSFPSAARVVKPTQKVKRLAMSPVLSLIAGWKIKLPLALLGGGLWNWVLDAGRLYAAAFGANPALLQITASVVALDFVAGLYRARRNRKRITSGRMRATGWKTIEYAIFVLVCLLISSGIRHSFVPDLFAIWGEASMIYIIITEGVSCIENAFGKEKASRILGGMQNLTGRDLDLTDGEPSPKQQEAEK